VGERGENGMKMAQQRLEIGTGGQGLYEITGEVARWVAGTGIAEGLLTLFIRHSSASLLIQENAAPEVRDDLLAFFRQLAPEDLRRYRHQDEGPDDMPAHIRSALLPTQLAVPVAAGRPLLGTWQGIYVFEHRREPHLREVVLHLAGE
jgi:secondary thiamine-phosphate synthase enzyme